MSSEIWTPGSSLEEYRSQFNRSVAVMEESGYIFPSDGRMHAALGMLSIGGNNAAVVIMGSKGGGKSKFGEIAMGAKSMITLEADDRGGSILGQPNPINAEEFIYGKLGSVLDPEDPRVFFDELPQLRNKGSLQSILYGNRLMVGGKAFDMTRASRLGTGNYTDGVRNFPIDAAGLSRIGMMPLAGDLDYEQTVALFSRGYSKPAASDVELHGVIPTANIRAEIAQKLQEAYPVSENFGRDLTDLMKTIKRNPLLKLREEGSDGRVIDSVLSAVIAMRLAGDHMNLDTEFTRNQAKVDAFSTAQVAALVLPTQVELSFEGIDRLGRLIEDPNVSNLVQEVALRQALAGTAYLQYALTKEKPMDDIVGDFGNFMKKGRAYSIVPEEHVSAVTQFRNEAMESAAQSIKTRVFSVPDLSEIADKGAENVKSRKRLFGRRSGSR